METFTQADFPFTLSTPLGLLSTFSLGVLILPWLQYLSLAHDPQVCIFSLDYGVIICNNTPQYSTLTKNLAATVKYFTRMYHLI